MMRNFNQEEWEICLKVLYSLKEDPFDNPDNQTIKTLISAIHKQAKKHNKKGARAQKADIDHNSISKTSIVYNAQNNISEYTVSEEAYGEVQILQNGLRCYSCQTVYTQLHFFYHKLCPACAEINYGYRMHKHDFSNYNVVITGGRVKIGYAAVLKFLRSNANVILTSRFPALALEQLQLEKDYEQWKNRLTIYGLDLRNLKAVHAFISFCHSTFNGLDILINNAAQTIKYPSEYYHSLIAKENKLLCQNQTNLFPNKTPVVFQQYNLLYPDFETKIAVNRFGQPIDHRDNNSWNATLTGIPTEELLEVNLINHIAPYQLISGLKSLMLKSENQDRFIINVTSTEGQFSYPNKTIFHPHTNMTKAALNMLTKTSAGEFVKDSIFMTAVDVGWISTGVSETKRAHQFNNLRIPPLDPYDGASRIVHPISEVLKGNRSLFGVLLKDYQVVDW